MNKDNVAEKWSEQIDLCLQSENPREQIDRYIKSLLTSQRRELEAKALACLPRERRGKPYWKDTSNQVSMLAQGTVDGHNSCLSQVKEAVTSILKEE